MASPSRPIRTAIVGLGFGAEFIPIHQHDATHCVGPCLALERKDAEEVSCFGSGRIRGELVKHYGSPFAIESAHVKLRQSVNWTCTGILAHESALQGAAIRRLPEWSCS